MEQREDTVAMLHRIPSPAFLVMNGSVTAANAPAVQRGLCPGTDILSLLATGQEEYARFQDGCLYLTVRVCDIPTGASVTRMGENRLFVLEQEADQAELRSMALAAQTLRGPLSNVMSVANHLFPLTGADQPPEEQARLAQLNRGLYQMLRIVCNMSDAYRYSTESTFRSEIRDIGALVKEQFDMTAPLMEYTGIALRYTGLAEAACGLVDAEMLERAIGNILSNALKFTPRGGTVDARLTRRNKMLYLTVQDSGGGLSPQVSPDVFTRYQRLPGVEDGRFGLGLGMVLVRSAAAAHGGTVLMEQGKDFGLRLTMTIPIRQPSDPGVRSPMIHVDYAGELDHRLLELSDCLPAALYAFE